MSKGAALKDVTELVIPATHNGAAVTKIADGAFSDCYSLTTITIPDSMTSIGFLPFSGCSRLTSIFVDENNPNYCSVEGSLYTKDGSTLICCPAGKDAVTIPSSVTSVDYSAFFKSGRLTSIFVDENNPNYCSIEGSLYTKDGSTLICCPAGKDEITIPNGVTRIESWALFYCRILTSVTLPDGVTSIGNHAFYFCSSLTDIDIPDSVTSIGEGVFSNSGLTSITLPDSVTSIGAGAFNGCTRLTDITIAGSITSIGKQTFTQCTSLTSITIPNSVTSIDSHVFYNCSDLTSITIPDSVTSIGSYAFYNCSSLTDLYYIGTEDEWNAIEKGNNWDSNTGSYTIHYNYVPD